MLGWLLFEPISGVYADKLRKKYLIAFALLFSSLTITLYPFASEVWHFAILAFGTSSFMSAYAVSSKALTAEMLPSAGKGKVYGRFVSAISVGGVLGPPLGGFITEWAGFTAPFVFSACLGLISLVVVTRIRHEKKTEAGSPSVGDHVIREKLLTRPFVSILFVRMLFMFNLVFRQNFLPVFLNESPFYKASKSQIGIYMGAIQFSLAVSQAFLGELADRIGCRKMIFTSLLLSGLSYIVMFNQVGIIPLYVLGVFQGVFFATAHLCMMLHLMSIMPGDRTGIVMGIYSESENVGGIIASPLLGFIYEMFGPAYSFYTISAILVSNSMITLVLIKEKERGKQPIS
jgi:predicted MFS family arabinose efflux permease